MESVARAVGRVGVSLKQMKAKSKTEKQFERIAKTVADPRRFEILKRVAETPELACTDLHGLPITKATLSHHMKELEAAGLVEVRKEGKYAFIKLRREVWRSYLEHLKEL